MSITTQTPVTGTVMNLTRAAALGHAVGHTGCRDGVNEGTLSRICEISKKR